MQFRGRADYKAKQFSVRLMPVPKRGGTVIVPTGTFRTGGLYLHSNTTLYLQKGAKLIASDRCEDYPIYPIPEGMQIHTDMQLIADYYRDALDKDRYRRAILSAYGQSHIAIIGEEGAMIDGVDCADPKGEEGFRGPHGIFMSNCTDIRLQGYTICNCGNFAHQIDTSRDLVMQHVTCLGGHDGIHLHLADGFLIEDCVFHMGDDCIAGINTRNLTVRRCEMNSACSAFRLSGNHILVENCKVFGPSEYPHRVSVVQGVGTDAVYDRANALPKEAGRHNMVSLLMHFGSTALAMGEPYRDVVFRRCSVEGVDALLHYRAGSDLQEGTYLAQLHFEDMNVQGLQFLSHPQGAKECPLQITMQNVKASMRDGTVCNGFNPASENVCIISR